MQSPLNRGVCESFARLRGSCARLRGLAREEHPSVAWLVADGAGHHVSCSCLLFAFAGSSQHVDFGNVIPLCLDVAERKIFSGEKKRITQLVILHLHSFVF